MKDVSRPARVVLVSPWFLLFFLVVPILVVLSLVLHLSIPVAGSPRALFFNNIMLAVVIACRFLWYCTGMRRKIRYGAGSGQPGSGIVDPRPAADLRAALCRIGYAFAPDGTYGEKRDSGYLGTTIVYGGLLLLLSVGIWNNLCQFSGTILDGMGPTTMLNRKESYRALVMGPLASALDSLPKMQIVDQIFPGSDYPKGATVVTLIAENGTPRTETLKPDEPISYGAYDIFMTKLVFEPQIVIKDRDSRVLFDALVRLDPLVQKRGEFSVYGTYTGVDLLGGVYYQPEKSLLKVVITRNGKREVADMTFQVNQQAITADYLLSCAKMGQWSEIHVVRRRNMTYMVAGGVLALLGLLLRVACRPKRIWLKDSSEGCRVYATDKECLKLIGNG